jgi:4-amino-4-deoxy-L-arabinose transferase-like glycosyltransferase
MLASRRRFEQALALIAAVALALRAYYTLVIAHNLQGPGDFYFYHWSANLIADGRGFIDPFSLAYLGTTQPTAMHPPLWPALLSVVSWLGGSGAPFPHQGGHGYFAHRLTGGVCGTVTVVLIGLLGRRVGGPRVGIVAAVVAAIYPILIVADGSLLSESLYGVFIAASLLLAYRLTDKPTVGRAVALGAAVGAAALTREEALLLVVLLFLPLAGIPSGFFRRRVPPRMVGVAFLATVVVVLPWVIRNTTAFNRPVSITTGSGAVLAGANCPATYHGKYVGFWQIDCIPPRGPGNEAVYAARWRKKGTTYAENHVGRLAVVEVVRVLRTWGIYQATNDPGEPNEPLAVAMYLLLLPLAIAGVFVMRLKRKSVAILLATPVLVTITTLTGYGTTRFRHAAEIPLVILASMTIVYAWENRSDLASLGEPPEVAPDPPG